MRIGINLLYLLPDRVGGTETYAAGLLNGLARAGGMHEYIIFVNSESAYWPIPQASNFTRAICSVKAINRIQRYFFEQFRLPSLLKKHKIDVVHSLGYVGPLSTSCPAVVTLPDLNFQATGHAMPLGKRYLLKFFSSHAAQRAKAIITISDFSKKLICKELETRADKVVVTLLGPRWENNVFSQDTVDRLKSHYGVSGRYIAAFGGWSVHKNVPRLLQAFTEIRAQSSCKLVIIGPLPGDVNPKELPEDVITTGYIPAEHLLPILSGADVFIFPSLYEGFGLPVLEAQQVGVPVVCSTAGSLPEVAGESAIFFDPYSVSDMAEKVSAVTSNPELRSELREKGLRNIRRFSWEQTAQKTIEVYSQVYATSLQA